MDKFWIVIDVGCQECGVDNKYIGSFASKKAAEDTAMGMDGWRDGGQTQPTVFEVKAPYSTPPGAAVMD